MIEKPKIPIVTYQMVRNGQLEMGMGYFVELPDGRAWCFPDEDAAEKQLFQSYGFQLDPQHLQLQPDNGVGRRLYLYRPE